MSWKQDYDGLERLGTKWTDVSIDGLIVYGKPIETVRLVWRGISCRLWSTPSQRSVNVDSLDSSNLTLMDYWMTRSPRFMDQFNHNPIEWWNRLDGLNDLLLRVNLRRSFCSTCLCKFSPLTSVTQSQCFYMLHWDVVSSSPVVIQKAPPSIHPHTHLMENHHNLVCALSKSHILWAIPQQSGNVGKVQGKLGLYHWMGFLLSHCY